MTEAFRSYSVLIAKPELPDLKKLADVLEEFHRVSGDEAVEMARRSWGFAGENLPQDRAILFAGKCRETGIKVRIVDSKDIASLPAEKDLIKAGVKPTGMNYTLLNNETGFVPWEKTVLIAAAPVKEKKIISQVSVEDPDATGKAYLATIMANAGISYPSPSASGEGPVTAQDDTRHRLRLPDDSKDGRLHSASGGLPEGLKGPAKQAPDTVGGFELFFYLELFFSVFPWRLRIRSDSFDYSCLGKRKEYSSQLNFRIFLDDVAAMALKSLKNQGTRAILGGKPLYRLGYDCLSHLEKESRWLLTTRETLPGN